MDDGGPQLPIGSGVNLLLAAGLRNGSGDHALLIREGRASRALITAEPRPSGHRQRIVVTPLDDDTELRVDGDALAVWLAAGSVGRGAAAASAANVPPWASAAGFALLLILLALTLLGAATAFAWLLELLASG